MLSLDSSGTEGTSRLSCSPWPSLLLATGGRIKHEAGELLTGVKSCVVLPDMQGRACLGNIFSAAAEQSIGLPTVALAGTVPLRARIYVPGDARGTSPLPDNVCEGELYIIERLLSSQESKELRLEPRSCLGIKSDIEFGGTMA